mgnify:CR=1 FL=1
MAQLWGGRFTKETDQLVYNFNASISFDQKFYKQDIRGSIAHVTMLAASGILTDAERDQIIDGLNGILADVENGTLEISSKYEDIHSFVEANLIDRIGDVGKKLHTGRSRNDQVALDMRLYVRDEILEVKKLLVSLMKELHILMNENVDTYMPGFTHLQKAQPVTFAHHVGAYMEMFKRDYSRMNDIYTRMNYCPLGAGALAGTTYPLDRNLTASLLDFDGPTLNSMDSVSDRDYVIEMLSAFSTIMMHLSRFSEEIIIWNSNEYQFVELDDAYSTGSSIMPQKKNPDVAELIRDRTGYDILQPSNINYLISLIPKVGQWVLRSIFSFGINIIVLMFVLYFMLIGGLRMEEYCREILPFNRDVGSSVMREVHMLSLIHISEPTRH